MSLIQVVTTVHHPDDTRILERLVRTLEPEFEVRYVCPDPGPSDHAGLDVRSMGGGRLQRWFSCWRLVLSRADVTVVHDPELLPHLMMSSWLRRSRGVFDLHENLPAQILDKHWLPAVLRRPIAGASRWLLRLAERTVSVTLAEEGYRELFRVAHPVFPNHLATGPWPGVRQRGDGWAIYVGDVTPVRGIDDAVVAAGRAGMNLCVIGRCEPRYADLLRSRAEAAGIELDMTGRLPFGEAMTRAASASVGISPLHDIPNYRDSLPTKILEYLAVGLPVVATDLPGTRAILADQDHAWLVPPGDVAAMSEALVAASDPQVRSRAAEHSDQIRQRYRWPAEDVVRFYREIMR